MTVTLCFRNGDKRILEVAPTAHGFPPTIIHWQDGDANENGECDIGGKRVGIREFWVDPIAGRLRVWRYDEVGNGE